MHHEILTKDKLESLKTDWNLNSDSIILNEIDRIIVGCNYGAPTDRTRNQSTYFGLVVEDRIIGLTNLIISGDGNMKIVKLQDVLLEPNASSLSADERLSVVVEALKLLIKTGGDIASHGNHEIKCLKMYGRTDEVLGGLKLLADDLFDALERIGINISTQGRWFEMVPIKTKPNFQLVGEKNETN